MTTIAVPPASVTASNRAQMDEGNPQTIADHHRNIRIGSVLRSLVMTQLRAMVPVTDGNAPSGTAVQTVPLAQHGRASRIVRAYARAGTVTGELIVDVGAYAAPASGHIAVQPDGNIALLAADAITSVDIAYDGEYGDVLALPALPVVANSLTLPPVALASGGVVLLLSATSTVGTTTGVMKINKPNATNTTGGTASLDVAKTHVLFASGDAVTMAAVTLLVCSAADLTTYLSSQSNLL